MGRSFAICTIIYYPIAFTLTYSLVTSVQSNLAKGCIAVRSLLVAANAFIRRLGGIAHSPAAAGEQCAMHSCVDTLQ